MFTWQEMPRLPRAEGRIDAIDLARGIAIGLMILSHTVSGLIGIRNVPDWGMVPVHFLTKFSSSLFILVFGIALAVAFLASTCNVPDDQIAYRSYPLLAARELLQQFIREQVHGHQAA